jgi:hypothetical protein
MILLDKGHLNSVLDDEEKLTFSTVAISFSARIKSCKWYPACAAAAMNSSFVGVVISSSLSSSSAWSSLFARIYQTMIYQYDHGVDGCYLGHTVTPRPKLHQMQSVPRLLKSMVWMCGRRRTTKFRPYTDQQFASYHL